LATSGTVTFEGYDPRTLSLCGTVEVEFNEGESGSLNGSFQAKGFCYPTG
jgi:hypothetical protein